MVDNSGIASAWICWWANKLSWLYVKRLRSYEIFNFSIDCFSAPYRAIMMNFSLVNFDLCFFKYTKSRDDWLKITPPLVRLIWTFSRHFATGSGFPRKDFLNVRRYKWLQDFMTVVEKYQKYVRPKSAFSVNWYSSPYHPIWVQFEEVAFSVNCFTTSYSPIWIQWRGSSWPMCLWLHQVWWWLG